MNIPLQSDVHAQEISSPMYVRASRLTVRVSPAITARIENFLPTNTPVWVKSHIDEWCEIVGAPEDGKEHQYGYVACRYLAAEKLHLEELNQLLSIAKPNGQGKLDLLQQKFWISPSPENLSVYGAALDNAYPSSQRDGEVPQRPLRSEYEAMKAFLRAGWSPARFEYLSQNRQVESGKTATYELPKVTRSIFGDQLPQLILAPYIGKNYSNLQDRETVFMSNAAKLVDEVLSRNSVGFVRIVSIARPLEGSYGGFYGNWDVGGYSLQFDKPALPVVAITMSGKSFNTAITQASTETVQFEAECDQIGQTLTLAKPITINDAENGILVFIAEPDKIGMTSVKRLAHSRTKPLSGSVANTTYHAITGDDSIASDESLLGYHAFITAFDLNDDGIADIAFEGIEGELGSNSLSTGPKIDRIFAAFVNLNGNWVMHSIFSPLQCES